MPNLIFPRNFAELNPETELLFSVEQRTDSLVGDAFQDKQ